MQKKIPVSLYLLGDYKKIELEQFSRLFMNSSQWEKPWKLVDKAGQADYFLIAHEGSVKKNVEIDRWQQQYNFCKQNTIIYSTLPSDLALWHLPRSPSGGLSFFRVTRLLSQIGQTTREKAIQVAPSIPEKASIPAPVYTPASTSNLTCNASVTGRHKILVVGSVGAGKTKAINTLTKGQAFSTEARPSDQASLQKDSTTVAMDFGIYQHDDETTLRLYGSPGQRRFDFMQDILLKKASGVIILLNNQMSNVLAELNYYLSIFDHFLQDRPAIIGVTHNDLSPLPSLKTYSQFLQSHGKSCAVFKVDARCYEDMHELVDELIQHEAFRAS